MPKNVRLSWFALGTQTAKETLHRSVVNVENFCARVSNSLMKSMAPKSNEQFAIMKNILAYIASTCRKKERQFPKNNMSSKVRLAVLG